MIRLGVMAVLLSFLAAGCSTMEVQVDHDPDQPFSGLKTYDWIPGPREPTGNRRIDDNTLLDKRVRKAVEGALNEKGFRESSESPDCWLAYTLPWTSGRA